MEKHESVETVEEEGIGFSGPDFLSPPFRENVQAAQVSPEWILRLAARLAWQIKGIKGNELNRDTAN